MDKYCLKEFFLKEFGFQGFVIMASFCNLNPNFWPPALWFCFTQRKVTIQNIGEMAVEWKRLEMGLCKNLSAHFMEIVVEIFLLVPRLMFLICVYYLRRLSYGKALFSLQNNSFYSGEHGPERERECVV